MKNKNTMPILFAPALALLLGLQQVAVAQDALPLANKRGEQAVEQNRAVDQAYAKKTQLVTSQTLFEKGAKILGKGEQLYIVNLGEPAISILRNTSTDEIWYVSLSKGDDVEEESVAAAEIAEPMVPDVYGLSQNFPNPFNPTTTINFQLPVSDGLQSARTVLKVYDVLGRLVRTVVDEELQAGFYSRQWDGLNEHGSKVSTGIYFYTIHSGDFREAKKMLLMK